MLRTGHSTFLQQSYLLYWTRYLEIVGMWGYNTVVLVQGLAKPRLSKYEEAITRDDSAVPTQHT